MRSNKMLRAGIDTGCPDMPDIWWKRIAAINPRNVGATADRQDGTPLPSVSIHAAAAIFCLSLLAACSNGAPLVTAGDTFCTRIDRFHATDAEREVLKANSGPLERLIRWTAGINTQWDATCLKPVPGP